MSNKYKHIFVAPGCSGNIIVNVGKMRSDKGIRKYKRTQTGFAAINRHVPVYVLLMLSDKNPGYYISIIKLPIGGFIILIKIRQFFISNPVCKMPLQYYKIPRCYQTVFVNIGRKFVNNTVTLPIA